jgi:hypothetical protein
MQPAGTSAAAPCPRPLIVLGPPRSFTSVVSTMLGQHPDMYALPETNLFAAETLGEWWRLREILPWRGAGLLRSVAELRFGDQSEAAVRETERWVVRRADWPTGVAFRALRSWVRPRVLVEASPRTSAHPAHLARLRRWAPRARYLHLVRHPGDQSDSLAKLVTASAPFLPVHALQRAAAITGQTWLEHHVNISRFLASVPARQSLRVRGEEVLDDPDSELRRIASWLWLRCDDDVIEAMKHPESSPFAGFGPPGARFGNDPSFLRDPVLRKRANGAALRRSGPHARLASEVEALALQFGYG